MLASVVRLSWDRAMDCGNHVALIAPIMPRLQSQFPHYQLRARLHHLGPVRTTTSPTMAGDHHVLHEDPALVKYAEVAPNRYKYFRWTPRTAWLSFWVAIAVPSVVGLIAYRTDGKYVFRGKRRGDVIKEF